MSLVLVLILLACLFGPPLLGGLTAGLLEYCQAKKEGRPLPSLLLPFPGFLAGLRQPAADRWALQWALLSLTLQVAAMCLLGLQRSLPSVLLFQAAGAWSLLLAAAIRQEAAGTPDISRTIRSLLIQQPLLFLMAAGLFFATGSFSLKNLSETPRLLGIDLPLQWLVLLGVAQVSRDNAPASSSPAGPVAAVMRLSQCYASGCLLLLAGFFWTRSVAGAIVAAVVLQVAFSLLRFVRTPWLSKLANYWGYAFFASGLNLLWVYIKYWQ